MLSRRFTLIHLFSPSGACWVICASTVNQPLTWTAWCLMCVCDFFACEYTHTVCSIVLKAMNGGGDAKCYVSDIWITLSAAGFLSQTSERFAISKSLRVPLNKTEQMVALSNVMNMQVFQTTVYNLKCVEEGYSPSKPVFLSCFVSVYVAYSNAL